MIQPQENGRVDPGLLMDSHPQPMRAADWIVYQHNLSDRRVKVEDLDRSFNNGEVAVLSDADRRSLLKLLTKLHRLFRGERGRFK